MPGFIDPHLHPSMAAILLPMHFITALDWKLPWADVAAVRGNNAFLDRLKAVDDGLSDPDEPLFSWGHHPIWHGDVTRELLNGISATRPIIVWHRGFHSLVVNDAAIQWMGLDEARAAAHPQVDLERGAFFETGLALAFRYFNKYLLEPNRFAAGLKRLKQVVHQGGHTTIGDMAIGMFDLELEWDTLVSVLEQDDTPFRVQMIPPALGLGTGGHVTEERLAAVEGLRQRNTHRLYFRDHIKMFSDGGFFAQLMQLGEPGFIDPNHHGEWMTPPENFLDAARAYWNKGYQVHVHCTGDLGLEMALDTLAKLQDERPRFDHRFTIEHMGVSTPEQIRRMAALGAIASVNVYYVHELSEAFYQTTLGHERASQMSRLGTLARHGIPFCRAFGLHDGARTPAEQRLGGGQSDYGVRQGDGAERAGEYRTGLERDNGQCRLCAGPGKRNWLPAGGQEGGLHHPGGRPIRPPSRTPQRHSGLGHGVRGAAVPDRAVKCPL